MPLEDVINAGRMFHPANVHRSTYVARNGDLKSIPSNEHLAGIINGLLYDLPEHTQRAAYEGAAHNPGVLPSMILARRQEGANALATSTSTNYDEVIAAMTDEELSDAALRIPDANKPFYAIRKKILDFAELLGKPLDDNEVLNELNDEDIAGIRTDYAQTYPNAAWRAFISQQNSDFIRKYAGMYVSDAVQKFAAENFASNGRLDSNRIKGYMREALGRANDQQKNEGYFEIGKIYSVRALQPAEEA